MMLILLSDGGESVGWETALSTGLGSEYNLEGTAVVKNYINQFHD